MYSDAEGEVAVALSRDALEAHVLRRPRARFEVPPRFQEKAGAFVTVNTHPDLDLRGCIGYPSPFFPLEETLLRAAEGAAEDPRFAPLAQEELDRIVVEVTLLTPPKLLETKRPQDLARLVEVGRDGLMVAHGRVRGVLLPQVPVEWGWDAEEYLAQVCLKAGLTPDAWLDGETRMYAFQGELFAESEPRGVVARRELGREHARR